MLVASEHSVDYICGRCAAVLLHADEGQIHGVLIRCAKCGSYNLTEPSHHWLVMNCDSCGTVVDLDLRVKPPDPEASIRVALREIQCPRCNGHGRPRIRRAGAVAVSLRLR